MASSKSRDGSPERVPYPVRAALRRRRLVFVFVFKGDDVGCHSTDDTRGRIPQEYKSALNAGEDNFVRCPIPLLHVIGTPLLPFLYEAEWPEGTAVPSGPGGMSASAYREVAALSRR